MSGRRFDRASRWIAATLALCLAGTGQAASDELELTLRPRVCTLAAGDTECATTVRAQWRSPRDESLCLVIVDHPDVRRCWEDYSAGEYSVEITFSTDLIVQLRDLELQRVLASEAVKVIREALRLRRKRRQPWDILP